MTYDYLYDLLSSFDSARWKEVHQRCCAPSRWSHHHSRKNREGKRVPSDTLLPLTGPAFLTESEEAGWVSVALSRLEECVKHAQLQCGAMNANTQKAMSQMPLERPLYAKRLLNACGISPWLVCAVLCSVAPVESQSLQPHGL